MFKYEIIDIITTLRCNAACPNCVHFCNRKDLGLNYQDSDLTDEQIELSFEDITRLGKNSVHLLMISGGEPLLHPKIEYIVSKAQKLMMDSIIDKFCVESNLILKAPQSIQPFLINGTTPDKNINKHKVVLMHPDDIPEMRPTYRTCPNIIAKNKASFWYKGWTNCCVSHGYIRLLKLDYLILPHLPLNINGFPLERMDDVCQHCVFGCKNPKYEKDLGAPISSTFKRLIIEKSSNIKKYQFPEILHLYWNGGPMSKLQVLTITSFHKLNPLWRIKIYIPDKKSDNSDRFMNEYTGQDYFDVIKKLSYVNLITLNLNDYNISYKLHDIHRSDILRYHLLYDEGGFWSDFDVLWLQPMNHFHKLKFVGSVPIENAGMFVTMHETIIGFHSIGVLASIAKHPYYGNLINICHEFAERKNNNISGHQEFGSSLLNELYPHFNNVTARFKDAIALHYETFYPYSVYNMELLYNQIDLSVLNDNVMAIHWFNGHVLSKQFVNGNIKSPCSMSEIIKNLDASIS